MRAKTFKPYNALIALLAALALCFCAACSSDEDDEESEPAYYGTWTPTETLINYLNTQLSGQVTLTTSDISITVSSGNSLTLNVSLEYTLPISGSYTYEGDDDTEGTFYFRIDYSSLSAIRDARRSFREQRLRIF